jgi:hypothetical protein
VDDIACAAVSFPRFPGQRALARRLEHESRVIAIDGPSASEISGPRRGRDARLRTGSGALYRGPLVALRRPPAGTARTDPLDTRSQTALGRRKTANTCFSPTARIRRVSGRSRSTLKSGRPRTRLLSAVSAVGGPQWINSRLRAMVRAGRDVLWGRDMGRWSFRTRISNLPHRIRRGSRGQADRPARDGSGPTVLEAGAAALAARITRTRPERPRRSGRRTTPSCSTRSPSRSRSVIVEIGSAVLARLAREGQRLRHAVAGRSSTAPSPPGSLAPRSPVSVPV